VRITKTNHTG